MTWELVRDTQKYLQEMNRCERMEWGQTLRKRRSLGPGAKVGTCELLNIKLECQHSGVEGDPWAVKGTREAFLASPRWEITLREHLLPAGAPILWPPDVKS